jgi:predicted ATPase
MVEAAAVLGRLFRPGLLQRMLEVGDTSPGVEAGLQALEERGLVYRDRVIPDEKYSFRHVLAQEAVYASLAPDRRGALHRAAGAAIEALYRGDPEPWYEALAYHYERGEEDRNAARYLLLAGEKSRRAYLNEEALASLRRALARLQGLPPSRPPDDHQDT